MKKVIAFFLVVSLLLSSAINIFAWEKYTLNEKENIAVEKVFEIYSKKWLKTINSIIPKLDSVLWKLEIWWRNYEIIFTLNKKLKEFSMNYSNEAIETKQNNSEKEITSIDESIFNKSIWEDDNINDIKNIQYFLKHIWLYNWSIDWNYSNIEEIIYNFQIDNGIISSKNDYWAWYWGIKTRAKAKELYEKTNNNEVINNEKKEEINNEQKDDSKIIINPNIEHNKVYRVDVSRAKERWIWWQNEVRSQLWLINYNVNPKLEKTAQDWANSLKDRWALDVNSVHKRDLSDSYYDYNKIANWMKDRWVVCSNKNRVTFSESVAWSSYYCSKEQEDCTYELIDWIKKSFDRYMAEKDRDENSRPHYNAIISPSFRYQWVAFAIKEKSETNYEVFITTHYCTELVE